MAEDETDTAEPKAVVREADVAAPAAGDDDAREDGDAVTRAPETAALAAPVTPEPEADVASGRESVARESIRGKGSRPSLSGEAGPLAAYEALARSARLPDLVAIAEKVIDEAAAARRPGWTHIEKVSVLADEARLARADADTPFGNVLKVLGEGPEDDAERALASAVWAHAIAEARRNDEDRLAGDVLWLATHTAFDATPLLDRALGEDADELWIAIGHRIKRIDEGKGTSLGRGEAIIGSAALAASSSPAAHRVAGDLAGKLRDPMLSRLLEGATVGGTSRELRLEGEAIAPPRGPVATTLLAVTGLLFVMGAARLVARVALAYRRPAEVSVSEAGIRMKTRTEMLGRVLREREHVIVKSSLARVVREVRYPRAAFYAGLLALAIGSYLGVRTLGDGVRSASPSLLLAGLLVVIAGVAIDFVLGSVLPSAKGRVRISFVPRTGATLSMTDVDADRADEALMRALAR
ncbi:MAG: hypothetical protein JWP97_1638 [Labilithrix sp.]|nr:hypothetical protein [Labilithrix sp.]